LILGLFLKKSVFTELEYTHVTLILACLKLLDEHFRAKKLIVMQQIEDSVIIEGNSALIEILINNLLLNTIKHFPKNSNITVVLNKKGLTV